MKVLRKKWLIVFFLLLVWLPFIFVNDFYPFLRFGMFAEPVSQQATKENFVLYVERGDRLEKYNTYFWGIDEGVFNYLARKYYYQKGLDFLGKTLCDAHRKLYPQNPQKWFLYREMLQDNHLQKELVATYETQP
jgi:hypothetical protein